MREDDLAKSIVAYFEAAYDDSEVNLEEPYGGRGVADAFVRVRTPVPEDYLVELKSDAAIRHATGANEILRQFRRMERYFYADEAHSIRPKLARDGYGVHLLLLFAPTPTCVRHVADNRDLYASVDEQLQLGGVPAERKVAFLVGLDDAPTELGFLSVNGEIAFGDEPFLEAVPDGTELDATLSKMDDL